MSRLGILNPGSLLGQEIKQMLERRRDLWREIELLALESEDYATVSEVAGEAVVVKAVDDDTLARLDVLFVCPGDLPPAVELAPRLAGAGTVVFVSPPDRVPDGVPVVDGVNLDKATAGGTLVSPGPGAITAAHLLHPLRQLGLRDAVAWIVLPASTGDQAGVDELLDQTRGLLAFDTEVPQEVFGRRLAHNLYPAAGATPLAETVLAALDGELCLSLETVQAAIFHSVAASVYARCDPATTLEAVRQALIDHPGIEMREEAGSEPPGPVEAAGSDTLLIGEVRPQPREAGGFWLWGAADNLTLAGAANALAIAEALLQRPS